MSSLKLHIGCGTRIMEGFVNVDIRQDSDNKDSRCICQPDVIDDVRTLNKFKNDSADLLYSCHVFEHFKRDERLDILKRWKEILKTGGTIRLSVPDFEQVCKCYLDKSIPLEKLWTSLHGSQRHDYDIHYHSYDFEHLKKDLETVGFVNVRKYNWWEKKEHVNFDDYSQAYWPHMDKQNGILLSLNVEADKP